MLDPHLGLRSAQTSEIQPASQGSHRKLQAVSTVCTLTANGSEWVLSRTCSVSVSVSGGSGSSRTFLGLRSALTS